MLLPITVLRRLVGAGGSIGGGTGESIGSDGDDASAATGSTGAGRSVPASPAARTRIERFRAAFLVIAILHGLVAVGVVATGDGPGGATSTIVAVGALPFAVWAALPRRPAAAWYAGMGLAGVQFLSSFVLIPIGLVTLAIYGGVLYLGWTGRSALDAVFGAGSTRGGDVPHEPVAANGGADREPDATPADAGTEPTETDATAEADAAPEPEPTVDTEPEPTAEPAPEPDPEPAAPAAVTPGAAGAEPIDAGEPTADGETDDAPGEEDDDARSSSPADDDATGAVDAFRDALTDADPSARAAAIEDLADAVAAGEVPDRAAVDALAERLESDGDADVRVTACDALGRVGTDRARSLLSEYRLDIDSDVSRAASRALRTNE